MDMETVLFLFSSLLALVASLSVIAVIRFLDVLKQQPWSAIAISCGVGLMTVVPAIVLSKLVSVLSITVSGSTPVLSKQLTQNC